MGKADCGGQVRRLLVTTERICEKLAALTAHPRVAALDDALSTVSQSCGELRLAFGIRVAIVVGEKRKALPKGVDQLLARLADLPKEARELAQRTGKKKRQAVRQLAASLEQAHQAFEQNRQPLQSSDQQNGMQSVLAPHIVGDLPWVRSVSGVHPAIREHLHKPQYRGQTKAARSGKATIRSQNVKCVKRRLDELVGQRPDLQRDREALLAALRNKFTWKRQHTRFRKGFSAKMLEEVVDQYLGLLRPGSAARRRTINRASQKYREAFQERDLARVVTRNFLSFVRRQGVK